MSHGCTQMYSEYMAMHTHVYKAWLTCMRPLYVHVCLIHYSCVRTRRASAYRCTANTWLRAHACTRCDSCACTCAICVCLIHDSRVHTSHKCTQMHGEYMTTYTYMYKV